MLPGLGETICSARICDEHARCVAGIIAERQAVFDELLMSVIACGRGSGPSAAQHETTMGHGVVIAFQLLGGNEMYRGLVRLKVMRHCNDFPTDVIGVSALGENYIA